MEPVPLDFPKSEGLRAAHARASSHQPPPADPR